MRKTLKRKKYRNDWRASALVPAVAMASGAILHGGSASADDFWINPSGGNWSDNANWSLNTPPGQPTFNLGSTSGYTVNLTASVTLPSTAINVQTDKLTLNANGFSLGDFDPSEHGTMNIGAAAGQNANFTLQGTTPPLASQQGISLSRFLNVGVNGGVGTVTIKQANLQIGGPGAGPMTLGNGSITVIQGGLQNTANTISFVSLIDGDGTHASSVSLDDHSNSYFQSGVTVSPGSTLSLTNASSMTAGQFNGSPGPVNFGGVGAGTTTVTIDNSVFAAYGFPSDPSNPLVTIGGGGPVNVTIKNGGQFWSQIAAAPISIGTNANVQVTGLNSFIGGLITPVNYTNVIVGNGTATLQLDNGAVGNIGVVVATGGNLKVLSGAQLNATHLDLSAANSYDFTGGTINLVNGTLTAATFTVPATTTLEGAGNTSGNVTNNGKVSPGDAPGIITVNGNYTQGAGGNLTIGLGGTTAGTQYDQLNVLGAASWAGTLDVVTLGNFVPARGQSFDLFTFGSDSGTFSSIILPQPAGGGVWNTSGLYSTGIIIVVPEPLEMSLLGLAGVVFLSRRRRGLPSKRWF